MTSDTRILYCAFRSNNILFCDECISIDVAISQQVSADGNLTTSVLTYVPTVDDEGKVLSCRVEHPLLLRSALEQGWRLTVHCKTRSLFISYYRHPLRQ